MSTSNPDLLSFGSYNIHGCVGLDRRYDVERTAAVIRELGCDAVGLQEVDGRPGVQSATMQLQALADATGMTPIAVSTHTVTASRVRKTNALLTRLEVRSVRSCDLSYGGYEPRSALDVELVVGVARAVRVIVTHLGLSAGERRYQVRRLLTFLEDVPVEQSIVLLGDLNEWWPLGRPLRWLEGALGKAPSARSFPVWAPFLALDRICARPPGSVCEFQVHRSPAARLASDHYPVKANINFSAPGPGRSRTNRSTGVRD